MSNPLLEPIHGVSIQDYAAISAKMASGIDVKDICKLLGIEPAVFEEASAIWITRMQEDHTFEVTMEFGKYFGEADQHPKLGVLQASLSEEGAINVEKMKTDRYFYEELNGARQAAYEYGIDGAQWIEEKFGINLGDFQAVALQWMPITNDEPFETLDLFNKYREEKQKEYAAIFASEQGGNLADDMEF